MTKRTYDVSLTVTDKALSGFLNSLLWGPTGDPREGVEVNFISQEGD